MAIDKKLLRADPEYKVLKRRLEEGTYSMNVEEIDNRIIDLHKTRTFRGLKMKLTRGQDYARVGQTQMLDAIQREARTRSELVDIRLKLIKKYHLLKGNIEALQEKYLDKYANVLTSLTSKTAKIDYLNSYILGRAWRVAADLDQLDERILMIIEDIDKSGYNVSNFKEVLELSFTRVDRNV